MRFVCTPPDVSASLAGAISGYLHRATDPQPLGLSEDHLEKSTFYRNAPHAIYAGATSGQQGYTMTVSKPSPRRVRAIDPQMRPLRWTGKAHSREGRLFIALRRELVEHVGGKPNAAQRAMIDRIAMLQTHLARMDERMFRDGGELSDHASRQYLAWANATSRMIQALGLDAKPKAATSLQEHLARKAAEAAARAGDDAEAGE